jgi:hypothetical protein
VKGRSAADFSSFMAFTTLHLIIGGFYFVFSMYLGKLKSGSVFFFILLDADLEIVKVLLIIFVLHYSFFHFFGSYFFLVRRDLTNAVEYFPLSLEHLLAMIPSMAAQVCLSQQ